MVEKTTEEELRKKHPYWMRMNYLTIRQAEGIEKNKFEALFSCRCPVCSKEFGEHNYNVITAYYECPDPRTVDMTEKRITLRIRHDGSVIWINNPQRCLVRICQIEELSVDDMRKVKKIGGE